MMAELVQGQASMNQPGLKSDGLADVLQRARQVNNNTCAPHTPVPLPLHRAKPLLFGISRVCVSAANSQLLRSVKHSLASS